jgi:hypothetical protein
MDDEGVLRAACLGDATGRRRANQSALNATKHGLAAKKHLPEILGSELVEAMRRQFFAEWNPATATQRHLVDELARHAAALARAERIESGLLRTSARTLSLAAFTDDHSDQDTILAASVGAEALDRLTRHRRAHERAFLSTLERISQMRTECLQPPPHHREILHPRLRFDDKRCRGYLRRRWKLAECTCPSCAGSEGVWLGDRDIWQCRCCRHQCGLRSGTVMAGSSLSLAVWFAAIHQVVSDREVPMRALGEATGINRRKTVVALAQRILRALDSADSNRLLAGLTIETLERLARSAR